MYSDIYKSIWLKFGRIIDSLHFITQTFHYLYSTFHYLSNWLWPWFKATGVRESKTAASIISESFQSIWMEFGELLGVVGLMSFILILSRPIFMRENHTDVILLKRINTGLYSGIYWPFSYKRGMIIDTIVLFILIPVWMILIIIRGHICISNRKLCVNFLANLSIESD